MSYTYVTMDVSARAYAEIRAKMLEASYDHALHEDDGAECIDMHGLALKSLPAEPAPAQARCSDCHFWNALDEFDKTQGGFGRCSRLATVDGERQSESLAFAEDMDDYASNMRTKPEFYCSEFVHINPPSVVTPA